MSRKKKLQAQRAGPAEGAATPQDAGAGVARNFRRVIVAILVLLAVAAGGGWWWLRGSPAPAVAFLPAAATYVGAQACAQCHQKEHEAWRGSHHALAMQEATGAAVLGNFNDTEFRYAGIVSRFFRRDGKFMVRTDGPDGKLADFEIQYVFGVTPLQQYLVEFPGGRLQALSIAWDARQKSEGGQRWFHLYPKERITHGDELHWTGLQQNWNFMCADCHSTNLRKRYDETANAFKTAWSEVNVACESCHGPGSNHVAWARKEGDWKRYDAAGKGFALAYDERKGVNWTIDPQRGSAVRSRPRATDKEIEACARCHARRGQISEDYAPGRPIGDGYRISLIEDGLYWPDGQMRDEVYNYGSFLQSRMHAKGVTCGDCHDPHTQKLRAPGNAVCAQCHAPARFDTRDHHRHAAGSKGAQCAACHMPTTTFMGVDPRHDHAFRVPRPDRTVTLGTPNACNQCHADKPPQWTAGAVRSWLGRDAGGHQAFAEAFSAAARHAADARPALIRIADDRAQPAIARASALQRLAADPTPFILDLAVRSLGDPHELVRRSATGIIAVADADTRVRYLPRMLSDPVRVVRIEAARALASVPPQQVPPEHRTAQSRVLEEYVAVQRYNADRPESRLNLGALHAERGETAQAIAQYERALERLPGMPQAVINLADAHRAQGDEARVERLLREALKQHPRSAPLHHALGLSLVRQGRQQDALAEIGAAAKLDPEAPRYAYVHGVALHSLGRKAEGIAALEKAHQRFPGDRAILQALAAMERDRGDNARALGYAEKFAALAPDDPAGAALLRELRR